MVAAKQHDVKAAIFFTTNAWSLLTGLWQAHHVCTPGDSASDMSVNAICSSTLAAVGNCWHVSYDCMLKLEVQVAALQQGIPEGTPAALMVVDLNHDALGDALGIVGRSGRHASAVLQ
jgi:hypothetical protein